MPSSRMTATACTEKASLISKRSTSARFQPTFCGDPPDGFDRRHHHHLRREAARRLADDARERRKAERARLRLGHHDQRGGAVVDARRVSGRDRPVLLERGLQRGERLDRRVLADGLVAIDDEGRAFLLRDGDRQDLVGEPALPAWRRPPCDGWPRRTRPARCAPDAVCLGHDLARHAHVALLEAAPQAVVHHASRRAAPLPMRSPSRTRGSR